MRCMYGSGLHESTTGSAPQVSTGATVSRCWAQLTVRLIWLILRLWDPAQLWINLWLLNRMMKFSSVVAECAETLLQLSKKTDECVATQLIEFLYDPTFHWSVLKRIMNNLEESKELCCESTKKYVIVDWWQSARWGMEDVSMKVTELCVTRISLTLSKHGRDWLKTGYHFPSKAEVAYFWGSPLK